MASDLFPIRRSGSKLPQNTAPGLDPLRGNPLADAVMRAFRQTFGSNASGVPDLAANDAATPTNGTIVPSTGEINP